MRYCTKCVMPSTRPGIAFDEEGVRSACQSYEDRKNVSYKTRFKELETLCDKYHGMNGTNSYDCMVAVSGGKDSHYQTYTMKKVLRVNPLSVSVEDNFPMTTAGMHNIGNISEVFGRDIISVGPNIRAQKIIMKKTFKKHGKSTYFINRYIYIYPLWMASKFNTPLLIYGGNISYEYGGNGCVEIYSARDQISNGVGSGVAKEDLLGDDVTLGDLNLFNPPTMEDINKLDPVYISYFVEWNSFKNYEIAKHYGFHDLTHEWNRTHHVESMNRVDSRVYLVHPWLRYPKFGHASATDYTAHMIRYGMATRDEAFELVKEHDHALDPLYARDFCEFLGYTEKEFWDIIDKQYNRDLFEKNTNGH